MKTLAPIALFVYQRPMHLKKVICSLQENELSSKSDLIIFSDGFKDEVDKPLVQEVRQFIKNNVSGFQSIKLIEQSKNIGLANSIINGVSIVLQDYENIIVIEDDLLVARYFLNYMNDALNFYKKEERVISIHGYIYPIKTTLPETFFLRGADCWGWATWKRGWDLFEENSKSLLKQIDSLTLKKEFDYQGAFNNYRMLKNQRDGKIDSWAIRWHASAFIKNKLTLYPGKSLVKNIGVDGLGTHVGSTRVYDTEINPKKVEIKKIPVEIDPQIVRLVGDYFKSIRFRSIVSGFRKRLINP